MDVSSIDYRTTLIHTMSVDKMNTNPLKDDANDSFPNHLFHSCYSLTAIEKMVNNLLLLITAISAVIMKTKI